MAAAKKPRIARLPPLRQLRRRVWQQPAGFLAVGQQSESVGRFVANLARQLRQRGNKVNGALLTKAAIANNIFKPFQFKGHRSERFAKRFFVEYPEFAKALSVHTRYITSEEMLKHWSLEQKILYYATIVSRGTFEIREADGKKKRIWTQKILPVNEALDLIEQRYRGRNSDGTPKSDIPDIHFEILRKFFPEFEKQLQAMGVDLSKARSISVPQLSEDMPEKPATRK